MKRFDALAVLAELTRDVPVVVTCAASSRELAAIADRPNHLYLLDSMGLAGSVATGLALRLGDAPLPRVVAIEGDGSLLMNPNVLATAGYLRPRKLLMVLLDNGVYGATANLPTHAGRLDLGRMAAAAGWTTRVTATADELCDAWTELEGIEGPVLLHVRIEPGNATDIPKLLEDPVILGRRFQDWLLTHAGATR
ncbi:sulfopyruvate decarboxylase subunit beta [Amycolatopsis xylanica]|uniref:Sulfopyruvate decarboxylase subunit beta n=1 Tax=Amycolatopsis xylanica TaxID=589385 RepID=A0A1H2SMU2_9PSEU|nr:thiamine pyrophosphate-dependent enzyme [Amycolatopsis xylanica]SDW32837.1 sulfopyruvate decarboxylase subunit beta [Amycolatopsis xylanica]